MKWILSDAENKDKDRSPVDDLTNFIKFMEYLEKKREKKGTQESSKKKDTRTKWMLNPDFENKGRTFTVTETTSLLILFAFPIAWGQIYIFEWFTHMLRTAVP